MRILFAGGGTGGHINPAIAIANYIHGREPQAEILFVGTKDGLEVELVPHSGYDIKLIKIHGFERNDLKQCVKSFLEIPGSIISARKIIKEFKPDIVIGTGGYVAGPVLYAAAKMNIPTLIHEANAYPGITTKIVSGRVDTVALGFKDAEKYIKKAKKLIYTGNPVRPSMLLTGEFEARREIGLDERTFIVFTGGSLGARDFNRTVVEWICKNATDGKYQVLFSTGKLRHYDTVMAAFKENGVNPDELDGVEVKEYIYNMDLVMAAADIVVSRAGACTLAELTALGRPSILVPSPYVAENHQESNARTVERAGGARVILDSEFTEEALNGAILEMTSNHDKLIEMKKSARSAGMVNSTEIIYDEVMLLLNKKGKKS